MTKPSITLVIGNDYHQVTLAGAVIRALCEAVGMTAVDTALLELAVVEAVNNIMEHACADLPGAEIRLFASLGDAREILIELRDPGTPLPNPPSAVMPDPLAESGRGWPLILASVDRVEYRAEGGENVLRLSKRARGHNGEVE